MFRLLLVAALVTATLTGCITQHTCVSWVDHATPQDAYDDAQLAVRGVAGDVIGVRDLFGAGSPVHRVEVLEVLGGADPGATIEVAATPMTCNGDAGEFPDGDPLDADGELILFLTRVDGGGWRLMTPYAGVLPMPGDGVLPFEVADR